MGAIAGSVTITGATGVITNSTGLFSQCLRNGAGDFTFTHRAVDQTEIHWVPTQEHAALRGGVAVEILSDTQTRVRCADAAGAAADPTSLKLTGLRTRFA